MALANIYVEHVEREPRDHKPNRLYVTDVGRCPRAVAYRLIGEEKDPMTESAYVNQTIMFNLADYIEDTLWRALDARNDAYGYQETVEINDRENWGGRCDIIADYGGVRVVEVKTVRPDSFNHQDDDINTVRWDLVNWPHPEPPDNHVLKVVHTYQAAIYDHYMKEAWGLEAPPLLAYWDRGGSNTPQEYAVQYDWPHIASLMDELDEVRRVAEKDCLVPPRLGKVLKLREYNKAIWLEPDWRCRYCDYKGVCQPDMGKSKWAERPKDKQGKVSPDFKLTKKADLDRLLSWATGRIPDFSLS